MDNLVLKDCNDIKKDILCLYSDGEEIGYLSPLEAIDLADELDLDPVIINKDPIVVKITKIKQDSH